MLGLINSSCYQVNWTTNYCQSLIDEFQQSNHHIQENECKIGAML